LQVGCVRITDAYFYLAGSGEICADFVGMASTVAGVHLAMSAGEYSLVTWMICGRVGAEYAAAGWIMHSSIIRQNINRFFIWRFQYSYSSIIAKSLLYDNGRGKYLLSGCLVVILLCSMETEIITIDNVELDGSAITAAAGILDGGGLVAFPTETVYGIGCKAERGAIERLDAVKKRGGEKRYTLHIGDAGQLAEYVPVVGLRAKKLISKVWPGPLTVVFQLNDEDLKRQREKLGDDCFAILYSEGSIGVRCPDDPVARALLLAAKSAIVAPSANFAGEAPATSWAEVEAVFSGKIDAILAKKKEVSCRYKSSSTVVKIAGGQLEILREGAVSKELINDLSVIHITFICTGNTCRSPMAEWFCRKYLSEKFDCDIDGSELMGYKVRSAGVMAMGQMPASEEVIEIFRNKGIDVSGHLSRQVGAGLLEESDFLFVMNGNHRDMVIAMCPEAGERCFLLDGNGDVCDPIGQGLRTYNVCAERIEKAVKERLCEILK